MHKYQLKGGDAKRKQYTELSMAYYSLLFVNVLLEKCVFGIFFVQRPCDLESGLV